MNIYQMYEANNRRFGFYVYRSSWRKRFARVIAIEGVEPGQAMPGKPPRYHGGAVKAEIYSAKTVKECCEKTFVKIDQLRLPHGYSYEMM